MNGMGSRPGSIAFHTLNLEGNKMIRETVFHTVGVPVGADLPRYTSIGAYSIVYFAGDGAEICDDCANGENGSEFRNPDEDSLDWTLIGADVYWEGPVIHCAHCNGEIESAYGDPDQEENE
jgi:hypothetical protein